MDPDLTFVLLGSLAIVFIVGWIVRAKTLKVVAPGEVLIVNTLGSEELAVVRTQARIIPWRNSYQSLELKPQAVECKLDGLECSDSERLDLATTFFVKIGDSDSDILRVVQSIGCARASQAAVLVQLFNARFSEALTSAASELELAAILADHQAYRDLVIKRMKPDLHGYQLTELKIDSVQPHGATSH